jgi:hypothetical protein
MPIRENREKALRYCVRSCASDYVKEARASRIAKDAAALMDPAADWAAATLAASDLGGYKLADAADALIAHGPARWSDVAEALAIGFLGSELSMHRRQADPRHYCRRESDDFYYVAFHGALAGLHLWPEADCLGRHLMNLWLAGGVDERMEDQQDYLQFYWYLLRSQYKQQWPASSDLDPAELGAFHPLYATVDRPAEFQAALVEYCDFRLARMHEYPSQHAEKRYHQLHNDGLVYGPLLLLPAELLAFKAIYERTTGKPCSLEGEHPLLKTLPLAPPAGMKLPSTALTAAASKAGAAAFGSAWSPGRLVEVFFDNPPTLAE